MKQVESQKSIGWFKLAEFVERGEKERALGIYKLLALSIDDQAFAYQLEGDILLAFQDTLAINKYLQAAQHYIKQHNIMAAIGTLNHLVILKPEHTPTWEMLADLYLNHYLKKSIIHLRNLINNKQVANAKNYIEKLVTKCQEDHNTKDLDLIIHEIKMLDNTLYQFALQVLKK